MASTRSINRARSAASQTPTDSLRSVARDGARMQIAGLSATVTAIAGWARAADRFVHAVGDELVRRIDGETDSRELIVGVASATTAHLRDLAALPSAAANHFDARLSRASIDNE